MKYGIYSLKRSQWLKHWVITGRRGIGTNPIRSFEWTNDRIHPFFSMTGAAEVGMKIPDDERVRLVSELGQVPS